MSSQSISFGLARLTIACLFFISFAATAETEKSAPVDGAFSLYLATLGFEGLSSLQADTSQQQLRSGSKSAIAPLTVKIGGENYSRSSTIDGGSYLYLELMVNPLPFSSLAIRCSFEIFPSSFSDNLFSAYLYCFFGEPNKLNMYIAPFFLCNAQGFARAWTNWGSRICFVNLRDRNIYIDALPFSIMYTMERGDLTFSFELISIGYSF